jgi:poly(3-hydroxybutyrate) depolymerase
MLTIRMRAALAAAVAIVLAAAVPARASGSITKELVKIDRDGRTYYLFVPDTLGPEPAPVVVTLHGSGRDGRPLVELFRDLATKERFIVVGPDANDRRGWQVPVDGPAFLYFLIEAVKTKHAVDGRRMYLFGHSAGASFALTMGLMESEYFAGAAAHSAALQHEGREPLLRAPRKLPIVMLHGTRDQVIPIAIGREGRDALRKAEFDVDFRELSGYEHNTLYSRGDTIVGPVWEFLKTKALAEDPHFQVYSYSK